MDVVFVMDVSLSMNLWFEKLRAEVAVVDSALRGLNLPSPPHYGLVVFVDDIQVDNGGVPYADVGALQAAFDGWLSFVTKAVFAPGFNSQIHNQDPLDQNYTWPENSLDALHAAATEFHWRAPEQALRMIIHTTDDRFWDGPEAPGCEPAWQSYPQRNECRTKGSLHTYSETIQVLRDEQIWVNTFAAERGGPPDAFSALIGIYRGTGVDVSPGFLSPYQGMNTIAESTGGLAWVIDDVLSGALSLSQGINESIVARQCEVYPPPPPPPPPPR